MILPRLIAHRGAHQNAPENTLKAFQNAAALGAQMFECDVLLTHDQVPVIFHDDTLERCTNGQGKIREMPYAYLKTLDAGQGEAIPTLQQVLAWLEHTPMLMNLELKYTHNNAAPQPLVQQVCTQLASMQSRILVSSFNLEALYTLRQTLPHIHIGLLIDSTNLKAYGLAGIAEYYRVIQAYSIHCDWQLLQPKQIKGFLKISPHLLAYTVNDKQIAQQLFTQGISGVFTDQLVFEHYTADIFIY